MHLQTLVIINSALILFSNNMHETQLYIDKDTFTGTYLNILDLQNKMRYRRPHILQNVNRSREVLLHKPEDLRDLSYCQTHQRILFSRKNKLFHKILQENGHCPFELKCGVPQIRYLLSPLPNLSQLNSQLNL